MSETTDKGMLDIVLYPHDANHFDTPELKDLSYSSWRNAQRVLTAEKVWQSNDQKDPFAVAEALHGYKRFEVVRGLAQRLDLSEEIKTGLTDGHNQLIDALHPVLTSAGYENIRLAGDAHGQSLPTEEPLKSGLKALLDYDSEIEQTLQKVLTGPEDTFKRSLADIRPRMVTIRHDVTAVLKPAEAHPETTLLSRSILFRCGLTMDMADRAR